MTHTYNGDGVLLAQTTGSTTTRHTQDLASPLSHLQLTQGTQRTDYVYGHERLLALEGTAQTWYGSDALGSVRQTLDATGAPLSALHYDPWGLPQGGATPPTFGFTGELQDGVTGLVQLRARWYQPQHGRFVSRDPFAGDVTLPHSLHHYAYVHNNPVNYIDPSGKYLCSTLEMNLLLSGGLQSGGYGTGFSPNVSGYYDLCTESYSTSHKIVEGLWKTDSLGALVRLFSHPDLPGGTGTNATRYRQSHLSAAAERLEFILDLTRKRTTPAQFGVTFNDSGFAKQFQDPWPDSSGNQVGHFLTAVSMGYDAAYAVRDWRTKLGLLGADPGIKSLSDDEVALRLIIGHEKYADAAAGPAEVIAIRRQYSSTTALDLARFELAISYDRRGNQARRDCLLELIVGFQGETPPVGRLGNSLQDLRLSLKGWRFGLMIRERSIVTLAQASNWLERNLR